MNNTSRPPRLNLPQKSPPPPPTPGEKDIEAARRRAWNLYHSPTLKDVLKNWYIDTIMDPQIATRVKDLYEDREQTDRQQGSLFVAKMKLPVPTSNDSTALREKRHDMKSVYVRVLKLYDARLKWIHDSGVTRLSIWSDWFQEHHKPTIHLNDHLLAAFESTLSFLEDDYLRRKLDFVTEVYAVLEKHDLVRARTVLADLDNMYPSLETDFILRVKNFVVGYDGLKKKLPQV
ncbi:Nn.00g072140.m01.CDS01 [Neocucurbitaria sp. VM-36]